MAGTKKLTLKTLSEELKIVKEQAEQISVLNERINKLENIIEDMKQNQNDDRKTNSRDVLKCRKCDKTFQSNKSLKKHVSENHPLSINCKTCKDSFTRICDLEVHIKTEHETSPDYKCDQCDKTFVLKWRLQKHKQNHASTELKKCYYFNNNIACPFEDLGCMFPHELSGACKFDSKCSTKLCPYQHTMASENNFEVNEMDDVQDSAEEDLDDNKCHLCGKTFASIEHLTQHMEIDHMDHFLAMVNQNGQTY